MTFTWTCPLCDHPHEWTWTGVDEPWVGDRVWCECEGCPALVEIYFGRGKAELSGRYRERWDGVNRDLEAIIVNKSNQSGC